MSMSINNVSGRPAPTLEFFKSPSLADIDVLAEGAPRTAFVDWSPPVVGNLTIDGASAPRVGSSSALRLGFVGGAFDADAAAVDVHWAVEADTAAPFASAPPACSFAASTNGSGWVAKCDVAADGAAAFCVRGHATTS